MSRSKDEAQADLVALAPLGWVWPHAAQRPDPSLFETLFKPLSTGQAYVEELAELMLDEIDPRTAVYCLPDFERVLGPDPCGRDTASMSLIQRQALAHERWTSRGGASIPYFVSLAAKRGIDITIDEVRPSEADIFAADDELVDDPEQFVWTVNLGFSSIEEFTADEGEADGYLYEVQLSDVECDIRRRKPAHTEVIFHYIPDNLTLLDADAFGLVEDDGMSLLDEAA